MPSNTSTAAPDPRVAIARNIDAEVTRGGHGKNSAKYVAGVLNCHPTTARRKLDAVIPFNTEEVWALAVDLGVPVELFFPDERATKAA